MNEEIRAFVEGCDCILGIGAMLTDFSSGPSPPASTD
jgi:indolepyruvate decarboxylase